MNFYALADQWKQWVTREEVIQVDRNRKETAEDGVNPAVEARQLPSNRA
jgi:hypothetical protein